MDFFLRRWRPAPSDKNRPKSANSIEPGAGARRPATSCRNQLTRLALTPEFWMSGALDSGDYLDKTLLCPIKRKIIRYADLY
jgi:hypothetical protein